MEFPPPQEVPVRIFTWINIPAIALFTQSQTNLNGKRTHLSPCSLTVLLSNVASRNSSCPIAKETG